MKNFVPLLFLVLFLCILPGCRKVEIIGYAGQKLQLIAVNGESYARPDPPFIEFGENSTLFGKVCNTFRGPSEVSNGVLTLKNAAATKKMCLDSDLNNLETLMLKMLSEGVTVSAEKSGILLKQGNNALTFAAVPKK